MTLMLSAVRRFWRYQYCSTHLITKVMHRCYWLVLGWANKWHVRYVLLEGVRHTGVHLITEFEQHTASFIHGGVNMFLVLFIMFHLSPRILPRMLSLSHSLSLSLSLSLALSLFITHSFSLPLPGFNFPPSPTPVRNQARLVQHETSGSFIGKQKLIARNHTQQRIASSGECFYTQRLRNIYF
jgi:hypothetical protein